MDELIEGGNAPEFTVSELSGAVKRVVEGEFGRVRVRGEVGRVSRPRSGHMYFDLKDENAVIAAVSWKGQVARMGLLPEEGMEVIASGRMTTFPGQSKYQLIVDDVQAAGEGALMAMLERRRKALAAEGLFDPARKRPIPFLPQVIGVVTSPSGAVIRDILHRLRERFPRHVLVWPVAVQGQSCAEEVARAIRGFNALPAGDLSGRIPRPDLLIVARGGGSLEDLWGFNEEIVVRAAAESAIPLISAVGHETDTTLIDHAADLRAPTPTAAAEMAVPVRRELIARVAEAGARLTRAETARAEARRQRLADLGRALGRPQTLLTGPRQRFDLWAERLEPGLRGLVARRRGDLAVRGARLAPSLLRGFLAWEARALRERGEKLARLAAQPAQRGRERLDGLAARLRPALDRLNQRVTGPEARLAVDLGDLSVRLDRAMAQRLEDRRARLDQAERLRQTLGYRETLRRGFAVVRDGAGALVTDRATAARAAALEIEFHDGRMAVGAGGGPPVPGGSGGAAPKPARRRAPRGRDGDQGSLF